MNYISGQAEGTGDGTAACNKLLFRHATTGLSLAQSARMTGADPDVLRLRRGWGKKP